MAYILTHAGCHDGFTAQWAILKGLTQERTRYNFQEEAHTCFEVSYGQPMPEIPDGQEVIIADFSYPEAVLRELAERSHFLTVLDHHKTAQESLAGIIANPPENSLIRFDMNKSGAMLAWQEFVSEKDIPDLIWYIQDRDLWTKKLPHHEAVTAYIHSFERTHENWDMLENMLQNFMEDVVDMGCAVQRFKETKTDEIAKHARLQRVGDYVVPVVNAPYNFSSDVCQVLLDWYPEAKFSAYYFDRADGIQQWGLRSRKDFDCSVVAKQFGGGGHAQACGFQIDPSGHTIVRT